MASSSYFKSGAEGGLIPDSPAVKRQKTASGYRSTSTSAENTGAYNSDVDSGDELLRDYIPDTPAQATFHTQPTQILDRPAIPPSSRSGTPGSTIEVAASSPMQGRVSKVQPSSEDSYVHKANQHASTRPLQQLGLSMAPAGTMFKPPQPIAAKSTPAYITIDDDDEGPQFQGGSSDEDDDSANIKPSTFAPRSAGGSFGTSTVAKPVSGNAKFQSVLQNAAYYPSRPGGYANAKKQTQLRPERAKPIEDIPINDLSDQKMQDSVRRVRAVFPHITVLAAMNALVASNNNLDDAMEMLSAAQDAPQEPTVISDDEIESPQPVKKQEPQMKRVLNAPVTSIKDRYRGTQAPVSKPVPSTPPRPKKRLMQGRRHPSSPVSAPLPSPSKRDSSPPISIEDYDSDSGVASASEEDPELDDRVLKYLNTCEVDDLVELTNTSKANAEIMVSARPFKTLDDAREVSNPALKNGKNRAKVPLGDKIVDTAVNMFSGYEAIDALVAKCEELGKPLAEEMARWGFNVFGAAKDGELEMTSFEDETSSQRDSGIGSPSSGNASVHDDGGDDDVRIVSVARKKAHSYLKKPDMMAEDCALKDYQVVGLNWLALMYRHELSCILADEMGLGKTCQVISLLSHLVETGHSGPHLVICPGSTLENWLREFPKFSPKLAVEPYYGAQKERSEMAESILERREQINVIVTTYDLAAKKEDNKFLRRLRPDVCVYDEGHYLKNLNSQRYQGLVKIPAKFKLLLTGTPLQNNLQELAALLAFILPGVFMERQEDLNFIFKAKATTKDAGHAALLSAQRIARARSMLTPFVLRRKKAQVLKHLPAKVCRVEYCTLHSAQKEIYDGHIDQARERARIRVEGGKIPKSDENNPLMQLRKAAIHPLLFRRHFTNERIEKMADILRRQEPVNFPASHKRTHLINEMRSGSDFWLHQWCLDYSCISSFDIPDLAWLDSGKVDAMVKLVKQYKENGDRVLIFSQFSLVLDILEAVLNSSLISFTRIDGSTRIDERQPLIDTFRDDETITAFLLTTKAGGTGINLMYANKVIIFDGSFNPQDDKQAENRAHRVGQTRNVEVVRLVTRGTVEEQIWALGNSKLALDGRVAGDDDAAGEEAGEKAVSKMLLEGVGMTDQDAEPGPAVTEMEGSREPEAAKELDVAKEPEIEVKTLKDTKKTSTASQSQKKKKGSILDFVTKKKRVQYDDEGNELLV